MDVGGQCLKEFDDREWASLRITDGSSKSEVYVIQREVWVAQVDVNMILMVVQVVLC